MPKDFDLWNAKKKIIDEANRTPFFKEREIWWCSLGLNIGFEEDGKGKRYSRPVLILKKFGKNTCLIIPLTTTQKKSDFLYPMGFINGMANQLLLSQIRLIDSRRLLVRIESVGGDFFDEIKNAFIKHCF